MTPTERVDALTDELIREVLIRIVESVEANDPPLYVLDILNDWSLLEEIRDETTIQPTA